MHLISFLRRWSSCSAESDLRWAFPPHTSAVGVLTEWRVSSSGRGQRRAESFWLISLLRVCKHLWTLRENRHVLSSPLRPIPCVVVYRRKSSITAQVHSVTSSFPPAPPRNSVTRRSVRELRPSVVQPRSRAHGRSAEVPVVY